MRILILGGDGYLGWPAAMHFAAAGHTVGVVDNYARRRIAVETDSLPLSPTPDLDQRISVFCQGNNHSIDKWIGDCADYAFLSRTVCGFEPDAIIHLAEQPSAPYSMMNFETARYTLNNNINTTFNVLWAIHECAPKCHLIKLGTMGEYGTPDIDIEEGWLDVEHKGRSDRFLYPRQAGSLYHTTKVLDTDLIWFYVRTWGIKCTDLMQGPVYGLFTEQSRQHRDLLPHFNYDDVFGTVLNRFIVQVAAGIPMTVYGKGRPDSAATSISSTRCSALIWPSPMRRPTASCASLTSSPKRFPSTNWPSGSRRPPATSASRPTSSQLPIRARKGKTTTTIRSPPG